MELKIIVGIIHPEDETKTVYWFNSSKSGANKLNIGDKVLCETCKGDKIGIVKTIIVNLPMEDAIKITNGVVPSRRIKGKTVRLKLEDITIQHQWKYTLPDPEKLGKRVAEYYRCRNENKPIVFDTDISFSKSGVLRDGYSAFLVARMFGLEALTGIVKI